MGLGIVSKILALEMWGLEIKTKDAFGAETVGPLRAGVGGGSHRGPRDLAPAVPTDNGHWIGLEKTRWGWGCILLLFA